MGKWVVYRTVLDDLDYMHERQWDYYVRNTPDTKCVEISRGLTMVEAINLTKLVNEQQEIEK